MTKRFNKYKRRMSIVTILCLVLTLIPGAAFGLEASDISNHWAKDKIQGWIDKNQIKGYEDGTFRPDNNISRAEFMTLVNGAFGYSNTADINFTDIGKDAWYANAVGAAKAAGYISGYPDNTMRPNNPISRAEAATIIKNIIKVEGNPAGNTSFTDQKSFGWSKDAVTAVSETKVMNGYPDGSFKPQNSIKRGEAVVALDTALNYSKAGMVYDKAGTHGPATGVLEVEGDVIVTSKDTILKNIVVKGNLIISKNVGDGEVTLDNVTVKGDTRIYGGGQNSIIIINSNLGNVTVYKEDGKIRILISGSTTVEGVTANSGATLEATGLTGSNSGFQEIILDASDDDVIVLRGSFGVVRVVSEGLQVQVPSGTTVDNLVLGGATSVTGTGTINNAQVNTSGTTFQTEPKKIDTAPGVTAPVVQTPATPAPGGGGGGGGSYTPPNVAVSAISVDKETTTLKVGTSETLTVTFNPSNATNKNVTWTSSNDAIVTVDAGVVTAVAKGTETITATSNNGKTATVEVTVVDEDVIAATVDYAAVWNEARGTWYIKATVPENDLDQSSVNSITVIKEAGVGLAEPRSLTPDTDTVLWFGVAGADGLVDDKVAGEYAYKVAPKDASKYIFNFTYAPESVTGVTTPNVLNTTQDKGYDTIQEAIDAAEDGDTIQIAAGTYDESVVVPEEKVRSITILGADSATIPTSSEVDGTIITGGMTFGRDISTNPTIEKSITVKGITFSGGSGLIFKDIRNVTVENNKFIGITAGDAAVTVLDPSPNDRAGVTTISNNYIDGVSGLGIYVRRPAPTTVIESNHVENTDHNSIQVVGVSAGPDVTITGNTLINWDKNRDADAGRAIRINFDPVDASTALTVIENTFNPGDDTTNRVDPEYVKITGVHTDAVGSLITQLADENTWTDNPDFATVILVNSTNWGPASITKGEVTTYYDSIGAAVEEVGEGETITLLADASGDGVIAPEGKIFTLDLGGHTYTVDGTLVGSTGTKTNGFQLLKDSTITIKNGGLTAGADAKILIQNYSNLTLNDVDLVGGSATDYVLSNNFGNTTLENGTTITAATGVAFDVYYGLSAAYDAGVSVTIADTNVVITGAYEYGKAGRVTDENWYAKAKLIIPMDYSLTAPEGFVWVAEDDKEVLTKAAVVGNKANLSTALADNTITAIVLSADIVLDSTLDIADKTITLDLNGHKLSTPDASGAAAQTVLSITGASNVTIQGDGLIQSGTTSSKESSGLDWTPTIHINNDSSSLTIKNSAVIKGGDAINSYDTAPAIWGQNFNELTITGATIRGGDHIKKSGTTIGHNNYSTAGHALALMVARDKTVNITNSTISGGNGINDGYEFNKEDQGYMQASGGQAFYMNQSNTINITDSIIEGGDSALHHGGHAIAVNYGVFNIINSNIVGGDGNTYWKYSVGKATSGNGTYNFDDLSTTADGVNSNPQ